MDGGLLDLPDDPSRDPDNPPTVGECRFDYLGLWVRCEAAGFPNVEQLQTDSVYGCFEACAERDDCAAVDDYFWLGRTDLACNLYTSTCDAPNEPIWAEEDAGKSYRKVCE